MYLKIKPSLLVALLAISQIDLLFLYSQGVRDVAICLPYLLVIVVLFFFVRKVKPKQKEVFFGLFPVVILVILNISREGASIDLKYEIATIKLNMIQSTLNSMDIRKEDCTDQLLITSFKRKDDYEDPFTGDQLRVRVTENGMCAIYSMGPDGRDDHGAKVLTKQSLRFHHGSKVWDAILLPAVLSKLRYFEDKWQGDFLAFKPIKPIGQMAGV
jgi:hypothetical protein